MANTAYLSEDSDHPEKSRGAKDSHSKRAGMTGDSAAGADDRVLNLRARNIIGDSDLKKAAICEKRARKLTSSISEMEDSIHMVRIFLSASEAIEELLVQSRTMLDRCRELSDPHGRNALAETFEEIKYHIDDIAAQANFHDRNLAADEDTEAAPGEVKQRIFQNIPLALTTSALKLSEYGGGFRTDAEIIDTAIRIDHAINKVKSRRAIADMALSVLVSRTKIARDKSVYLRDVNRSLTQHDRVFDEICEYSDRRLAREPIGTANQNLRKPRPEAAPGDEPPLQAPPVESDISEAHGVKSEAPVVARAPGEGAALGDIQLLIYNLDMPDENEGLNGLTKELARLFGIDSYLTHWFKYEEGETGVFSRVLAELAGPELKETAVQKYETDNEFKDITDKYMTMFEELITQKVEESSDKKVTIDQLLNTEHGKIYAVLAKACGRV